MEDQRKESTPAAGWAVRHRWWLLAAAAGLALASWLGGGSVDYDRSMESMFAPDDPHLQTYQMLQRTFGGNEVVLLVYTEPQLWGGSSGWLERMAKARQRALQVPGVASVLSIDRLLEATPGSRGRAIARIRHLFVGLTHGPAGNTVALVCMLDPGEAHRRIRQRTIAGLAEVARGLPDGALAGEPVMISEGFRLVEQDADRLTLFAGLLLAATIWLCFRSLRWVLIPALVVGLSVLLTHGLLALLDLRLTMVSSMLMAVVMVIAVATLMHVAVRYEQLVADMGLPATDAMRLTISQLGMPVVWTCLTDAAGFGALMSASVGPVHDFGFMLAIGSLAVLLSTALIVPATAVLHGTRRRPVPARSERLARGMERLPPHLLRHRWAILACGFLVALAAGWGARFLRIESDFTRNFRSDSALVQAYARVEHDLGGAGVCDIVIPAPDKLSWGYLQNVLRMEQHLRQELATGSGPDQPGLTKVISLADAVMVMSPVNLQRIPRLLRAPALDTGLKMMQRELPDFYGALYGRNPETGQHYLRIMLRTWERQPAESKTALIGQIEDMTRQYFPEAQVTGYFVLLTELIRSLLADQWTTFAVALVAIGIMMLVAFGRPAWSVAALLPNIVPNLLVLGLVGWLSLLDKTAWRVNMGVAMIAAVSTGLSIDGSVHYLFAYRAARRAGASHLEALCRSHRQVGRALGLATLALIVGFLVLCSSRFMPTVYFGGLASMTMAGGTIGNLIFLPLLLPARQRA